MGQSLPSPPSDTRKIDLFSILEEYFKNGKSKIISLETMFMIQSHLKNGNTQDAASVISDALRDTEQAAIDIAVTGEAGAGKSSFINALRGVGHEEEDAAETGVVETTTKRTPYKHPKFPSVTFWDLPGLGTTNFPPHTYLEKMKFQEYDFFFIISATRFTQNDAQLCAAIEKMKKNFYFVRTKVDSDLDNEQKKKRRPLSQEEKADVLQKIKDNCVANLQKTEVADSRVFLVSNFDLSEYDFPELQDTLVRELPAHKKHIFLLSLPAITEAAIDQKRDSLRQKIWMDAFTSGVSVAIPVMSLFSGEEVEHLRETLALYRSYFQLDDASLEMMAKNLGVSMVELKKKLKSPYLIPNERPSDSLKEMLLTDVGKFLCAHGSPLYAGFKICRSYFLYNHFLDVVVSDAKYLLKNREIFKVSEGGGKEKLPSH